MQTCEHTALLSVSRDYFKTILLGLIQKELDVKLKLLQTLNFFEVRASCCVADFTRFPHHTILRLLFL
jgi:hypothetical protein